MRLLLCWGVEEAFMGSPVGGGGSWGLLKSSYTKSMPSVEVKWERLADAW